MRPPLILAGAAATALAITYFVVARACAFDHWAVCTYAGYMLAYVALPGVVVLAATLRRPLTWLEAVTLGVPVGYAVEILSFLALAASNARGIYPWLPVAWALAAFGCRAFYTGGSLLKRPSTLSPWVGIALGMVFIASVVSAVAYLVVPSPLVGGQPAIETLHDWVYLVSRAAEIKHRWPLEDPSLAGTTLQYHYFLLVHVAASSFVTGNEVSLVLLRLALVPFGGIVVLQLYSLGSRVSGRRAAGVLAALLALAAGEVSTNRDLTALFGNDFIHWLYYSPTFYFGIIFTGALVLMLAGALGKTERLSWRDVILFGVMAGVATGAKGTVVPPLLVAFAVAILLRWRQTTRFPWRLVGVASSMSVGFAVTYLETMAAWGTGDAVFAPLAAMRHAPFWQRYHAAWTEWVAQWLPVETSRGVAGVACGVVVTLGAAGVRLLAWPYLLMRHWQHDRQWAVWLALVGGTLVAFGQLLHLDSYGQLYLLFAARLPAAVLAAAFIVRAWEAFRVTPNAVRTSMLLGSAAAGLAILVVLPGWWGVVLLSGLALWLAPRCKAFFASTAGSGASWSAPIVAAGVGTFLVVGLIVTQVNHWRLQTASGLAVWLPVSTPRVSDDMVALTHGLEWIRDHTEPNAILVVNAFTTRSLTPSGVAMIDRTTVDKHYYYSALSERRLWIEGPAYLRNHPDVARRLEQADAMFYADAPPPAGATQATPLYLVVDRAINERAQLSLGDDSLAFKNRRLHVYRVPKRASKETVAEAFVTASMQPVLTGDPASTASRVAGSTLRLPAPAPARPHVNK